MYPRQAEGGGGGGGYGGNKVTTYGIIISVLENFGFIQTYEGDEHLPVSRMCLVYCQMWVMVSFYVRSGPRGLIATNIRVLDAAHKVIVKQRDGEIAKEPDCHRHNSGNISFIDNKNQPKKAAFIYEDTAANNVGRICKGDIIKFTLETYLEQAIVEPKMCFWYKADVID